MFFNQIGEILFGKWYCHCLEGNRPFLFELLHESGAANDLAVVVCRSISIPQSFKLSFKDQHTLGLVRYACKASLHASNIEPWWLHKLSLALDDDREKDLHGILENSKTLKDLFISTNYMTNLLASTLLKGLSSNLSLSSCTLKTMDNTHGGMVPSVGECFQVCIRAHLDTPPPAPPSF